MLAYEHFVLDCVMGQTRARTAFKGLGATVELWTYERPR